MLALKQSWDEKISQLFEQKLRVEGDVEQLDDMLRDQNDSLQKLQGQNRRVEERLESQQAVSGRLERVASGEDKYIW